MIRSIKKLIYGVLAMLALLMPFAHIGYANSQPPSFDKHFAEPLLSGKGADGDEKVFTISCIDKNKSIKDNVQCLFFPSGNGGYLWDILRYVGYILVFIFIVKIAIGLLTSGSKTEDIKGALKSLAFLTLGAMMYFGALWIFSTLFNLFAIDTTSGLQTTLVGASGPLFFVLSLLKAGAFFFAVIMIVWTGFQMMNPTGAEEWEGKKLIGNLKGVLGALVGLKVVDFIYYIASLPNFSEQAGNFIIQIAKFMAYLSGTVIVLMIIYSGYLLVIDGGKWENFKKAKNTLVNIVLAVGSLFFFLLLLYQIFAEFN